MWLRVLVMFLLCFHKFDNLVRLSRVRPKRQDISNSDVNYVIEFFHNCSCVYYYQCDHGLINTRGESLFNTRLGQSNDTKSKIKPIFCAGGQFMGEFICCKYKPEEAGKPPVTTETPLIQANSVMNRTCGKQLPNINVRIFDDEDELTPVNGEFPWLVAIFKRDTDTSKWTFHASGTLIHSNVILTANHVVVSAKPANLKVIVNGQIELSQIGDNPLQERNVKTIVKNPEYNSGMLYNDVSLLFLEEPYNISTTPAINSLCLNPNISYEGKRCLVAGWGRTETTKGTVKVLKKVELPTHSHSKCQDMLAKALGKSNYVFHESLMCAGGETGKDACKGDGGSPLMCPTGIGNSMYQVGIVAWGIGCGKKDVPGVYANVQFLHKWIVDELNQRGIDL